MPDFSTLIQPDRGQTARTVHLIDAKGFDAWMSAAPPRHRAAAQGQKLAPTGYSYAILPGEAAEDWSVVSVVANAERLSPWCLAKLAEVLPEGSYRVTGAEPGSALYGWLTAQYKFDRYRKDDKAQGPRILLTGDPARVDEAVRLATAAAKIRDLVNGGANDVGPAELEAEAEAIAKAHGGTLTVTRGDAIAQGYGMIWAVGKAAGKGRDPRLIEIEWGNPEHPRVAIVGKGVCFDSGGLDIKPASGMRLMKKDMGGAAHALALAQLIMSSKLPVRLHMLVPAVENAISGEATRPGDVMKSRKGVTVENSNTDAEGRLILGDALTKAGEGDKPELVLDFATLTGAARVALGTDIQALFANDDTLASEILGAGEAEADPIWRLPLYDPYDDMLKSDVADMINAAEAPWGGALTAALFLRRFVPAGTQWAHFDIFCWNNSAKPGRPKGGEAVSLRAVWKVLKDRYAR